MNQETSIDPHRLLDAADLLLKAVESEQGQSSVIDACVGKPEMLRHEAVKRFTIAELVEAMAMLWRMGLVTQRPSSNLPGPH